MKRILFYSPDKDLCETMIMFFNTEYNITTTSNFEEIVNIISHSDYALIVIDSELNERMDKLCEGIKNSFPTLPIILTYVCTNKCHQLESRIKQHTDAIFYKPIDIREVSLKISSLITENTSV
jgi:DNA-binding response OmpR family regulator